MKDICEDFQVILTVKLGGKRSQKRLVDENRN